MNTTLQFCADLSIRTTFTFAATAVLTTANPVCAAAWMILAVSIEKIAIEIVNGLFLEKNIQGEWTSIFNKEYETKMGIKMAKIAIPCAILFCSATAWLILKKAAKLCDFTVPLSQRVLTYLGAKTVSYLLCSADLDKYQQNIKNCLLTVRKEMSTFM